MPRLLLALAGACLSLPALADTNGLPPMAEAPLIDVADVPCVDAVLGSATVRFAIDTSNVHSVIDLSVARQGGLTLAPVAGHPDLSKAVLPSLWIGKTELRQLTVLVADLGRFGMPPGMKGTLAYTAFKDRLLQIDWPHHEVRISAPLEGKVALPGDSDRLELITFGKEGPPIVVVNGFEIDGRPLSAQLDTFYTGSLLVYDASIARLLLAKEASTSQTAFFPYTDGGVKMRRAQAQSESFHGTSLGDAAPSVYFPTPDVHEPDGLFDATVGTALLKESVLTLDFHNQTLSVVRDGAASL